MQHLGDQVDGRPSRRERTDRRSEGGVGNIDANLGTRATRTGRQAGREGQATGDLPLPPPSALASGVIDGMLLGVLVWAILLLISALSSITTGNLLWIGSTEPILKLRSI